MLIYKGLAGSQLYGTALPESDTDYVEVHLPTKQQIFGLDDKYSKYQQTLGEEDISRFGVNQYMKLLRRANPNVLETIFCPANRIEFIHPAFRPLVSGEEQTMTGVTAILNKKNVVTAHLGYAIQQSNKMLPAKAKWAGPRREVLFDKYGYDVKYAAHAIRLTHQCLDLLERGYIEYPYRESVVTLLRIIREGTMKLSRVREIFADMLKKVQDMEKTDCAITDEDKTNEINQRLLTFYQQVGYAV